MHGDLMILRPFRILTFVKEKKVIIPPFFILFKKTQLFVLRIYFLGSLSHLLKRRNFTAQSYSSRLSSSRLSTLLSDASQSN